MAKSKKKKTAKPAKAKAPKKTGPKASPKKKLAAKKAPAKAVKPAAPAARPSAPKPGMQRRPKSLVRRAVEGAMRAMPRLRPRAGKYDSDLERNPANYQPLTPLTFLERAAYVFPNRTAIVHGRQHVSYGEFYARSRRLASALAKAGLKKGDTVAVMLANTPPMLEAHYGVPMAGGVLNALNTRLDAAALAFILDHGEAKNPDHRPRIRRNDGRDAETGQGEAHRDRL